MDIFTAVSSVGAAGTSWFQSTCRSVTRRVTLGVVRLSFLPVTLKCNRWRGPCWWAVGVKLQLRKICSSFSSLYNRVVWFSTCYSKICTSCSCSPYQDAEQRLQTHLSAWGDTASPTHRLQNLGPAPITAFRMGVGGATCACIHCVCRQTVCAYSVV